MGLLWAKEKDQKVSIPGCHCNSLIANEIGADSGAIYPNGEDGRYELKA